MDHKTQFWRVFFHCNSTQASHLGSFLEGHALAVSWFETKDSDVWIVEAITTSPPNAKEWESLLAPACAVLDMAVPQTMIEALPETDWLEATWRSFPPRQVGRYYIYGSHTSPVPPEGAIPLHINAATAFGSGEHETTAGCLLTLDNLYKEGRSFQNPLDMGCGSGILGIAVAKTWGVHVTAADNDPESVRVATCNAALNGCASLFKACVSNGFESSEVQQKGSYDLIVANILATPLIQMAGPLSRSLASGGMVILSGLLSRHQEDIVKAYQAQNIHFVSHHTLNDWVAFLLQKE